ncbi:unnamed protein product [Phaedon cochleariae]|uniref:NADP-dependent oxidoreductase domain-containing protein n=1 Tax=Phaedon cochleariae TaxID=80249 RepID=A0A9N9SBF1_PHACE|nr:unnamed protein product [Phaedon cochleariae]
MMARLFLIPILLLSLFNPAFFEEIVAAKDQKYTLNNGASIPMVGFGTWQIQGADLIKQVLDDALAAGYRLIDSATLYGNEADIGKALKELLPKHNLSRKDIFITSKLSPADHGEKAYQALESSLKNLDSGYIDLYLIHWPASFALNASDPKNAELRDESWKQLVKGVKNGLTKSIGVSNYNVRHLKELLKNDHGIKPVVNQVEWHPNYHQNELLELCKKENILLQAYSSLGGTGNKNLLENAEIKKIADKLGKSPAQVLLRWSLQQNIAIIPKARSAKYIKQNIDLDFIIPNEDMEILNNFNQAKYIVNPNKKYIWNPDTVA